MHTRRTALFTATGLLAGGAGVLAGCSPTKRSGTGPSGPVVTGSGAPGAQVPGSQVPAAQRMAAQYDYAAAAQLLTGERSPAAQRALATINRDGAEARAWPDVTQVSHLFYHSLIVDPVRAFAKDNPERVGYAQYMVTIKEFRAQLEQIYHRGYVLVHAQRLVAKDAAGVMRPASVMLPPGKKPLVLSVDDVNYYQYMVGSGFAANLTLRDGAVVNTYVDAAGRTHLGAYDVSTVIDQFVQKHPDFSYRGDKGTLALTGYNGILGYRSSVKVYGDTAATRSQGKQAKKVAKALKAEGWQFASHTWGHINMTKDSLSTIKADARLWDAEVRPLLGPVDQLVYPFGADISGMPLYAQTNAKYAFLHDKEKFDYYFPIDSSKPAWAQLTKQSLRQARINVDGISMQRELDGHTTVLENFFDTASTIDPQRPLPLPT